MFILDANTGCMDKHRRPLLGIRPVGPSPLDIGDTIINLNPIYNNLKNPQIYIVKCELHILMIYSTLTESDTFKLHHYLNNI